MSYHVHPTPVYRIGAARARRAGRLPAEVLAELEAAARLCDDLEAAGCDLRFHCPPEGGRVVATLTDSDGAVREVALRDVCSLDLGLEA